MFKVDGVGPWADGPGAGVEFDAESPTVELPTVARNPPKGAPVPANTESGDRTMIATTSTAIRIPLQSWRAPACSKGNVRKGAAPSGVRPFSSIGRAELEQSCPGSRLAALESDVGAAFPRRA